MSPRAQIRLLASLLLVICLQLVPVAATCQPHPGQLYLATCPQQAAEYRVTIRHRVLLHRAFLDAKRDQEEQIREGIGQQLKYFWGWFRTHKETHSQQRMVVGAEPPTIRILETRPTTYGRAMRLDWQETSPELKIEDPYTQAAVRRGETRSEDAALEVSYEAAFPLALCGVPRAETTVLPFALPRDPWLMHWLVPKSAHRLVRYHSDDAVTNPCVDDDYADLPHPFYYWYDWLPERHGVSPDGHVFDCRQLLRPGVDYLPAQATLQRVALPLQRLDGLAARLDRTPRPLRASVVIGVLNHEWPTFDYAGLARRLNGLPGPAAQPTKRPVQHAALSASAAELLRSGTEREAGEERLLRLLRDLPGVLSVHDARAQVRGGYLQVTIAGTLRRSQRPLQLRAYLGVTDVLGPTKPHHWPFLLDALLHDDVILYAGHSGVGENFRLARILGDAHRSASDFARHFARAPFQLIAFLSCFSYMYFGRDLEAAAQHAQGRAFVYTGSEYSSGDRGTLAVLDLVDQALAGTPAVTLREIAPEDFLLFKEVAPTP